MGCKERRIQEKAAMRLLILETAMELVSKKGLDSLTMRALAQQIKYSPSIVYEYFKNKEFVCKELCKTICEELLVALKKVAIGKKPEDYLIRLVRANVDFLNKNPQGIELLTLVCFGSDPSQIPQAFLKMTEIYSQALKRCECTRLQTEEELDEALDVIRSLHVGMMTLSKYQTTSVGLKRIGNSLENGIQALLKGWNI